MDVDRALAVIAVYGKLGYPTMDQRELLGQARSAIKKAADAELKALQWRKLDETSKHEIDDEMESSF